MNETLNEIEFYLNGKLLQSVWTTGYPIYREAEKIHLDLQPTARERIRRPKQDFSRRYFEIETIAQGLRVQDDKSCVLHMEVILKEIE